MPPDLEGAEKNVGALLDNGFVRVSSVIAGLFFAIGASWAVSSWFTTVTSDLESIKATLVTLQGASDDRWKRADMVSWCRETELLNPDWRCGEI